MTVDEQVELRKILVALDGLIKQFIPEDDLVRLALDPKRQAAAARMVGTATLAGDLLHRAYELCESMPHPNGLGRKRHGPSNATEQWILKHLPTSTVRKADYINKAVGAGLNRSHVYFMVNRLVKTGTLKQSEGKSGQRRELFT